jgi:hypothetical protein
MLTIKVTVKMNVFPMPKTLNSNKFLSKTQIFIYGTKTQPELRRSDCSSF